MRITSKGQVTIPQSIREELGLLPNTEVEFVVDGGSVRLVKVEQKDGQTRGSRLVRHLQSSGKAFSMTTEEIMSLTRERE